MRPRLHPLHILLAVGEALSSKASNPVEDNSHDPHNFLQDDSVKDPKDTTCRVAVCFSGHVRSFVYPVVHVSARRNLVDAIEAQGCQVDVFVYATLSDAVPRFKSVSVFVGVCSSVAMAV